MIFHFSLCEKYIGFKLDILRLFRLEISMFSDIRNFRVLYKRCQNVVEKFVNDIHTIASSETSYSVYLRILSTMLL